MKSEVWTFQELSVRGGGEREKPNKWVSKTCLQGLPWKLRIIRTSFVGGILTINFAFTKKYRSVLSMEKNTSKI